MRVQDSMGVRTPLDLEKKYMKQLLGIKTAMKVQDESIIKTNKIIEDYTLQILGSLENLQSQIDGNIATFFYSGIPSLNTIPTSEWKIEEYDKHLGDLYYDKNTGYAYRFSLDDENYGWIKISDTDVVEALAIANSAKDTADSKRTTFVVEPLPPYEIGDIWFNNGELYRCKITREKGVFQSTDWTLAVNYTDDTVAKEAKALIEEFKKEVVKNYITSSILKSTTNSINAAVQQLQFDVDSKNKVFKEEPTVPYKVGDIYIKNNNIYTCIQERLEGTYSEEDWQISLDTSELVSKTALNIALGSIELAVKEKIGADEVASVISQTAQKIFIESNNFGWKSLFSEMTVDGKLSLIDVLINGGKIILEDNGVEDPSIVFQKIMSNKKDLKVGADLSNLNFVQTLWETLNNKPSLLETLESTEIMTTNTGYKIEYIKTPLTNNDEIIGYSGKIILSQNGEEQLIYSANYYLSSGRLRKNTNIKEFQLPSDFGKLTFVIESNNIFYQYFYVEKLDEGKTIYSSSGINSKIYSTCKYNNADLQKFYNYLLGKITLTDEEKSFFDDNNDGKLNTGDFLRIINNGGKLNISDSKPGQFIIDTSNPEKTIRTLDKDGEIVSAVGLDGVFVSTKNNVLKKQSLIELGESISYKNASAESVVGTWIDGKKIYRTIVDTGSFAAGHNEIGIAANVDNLVKLDGYILNSNNAWCPVNFPYSTNRLISAHYSVVANAINLECPYSCSKGYLILEYTKKGE